MMRARNREDSRERYHVTGPEREVAAWLLAIVKQYVRSSKVGIGPLPAHRSLAQALSSEGEFLFSD
jgi:hypothetical protein